MFTRWLNSPKNYVMAILLVLAVYALALEELTYSTFGRITDGTFVQVEGDGNDSEFGAKRVVTIYHYVFKDPQAETTHAGTIRGAGWNRGEKPWKVGDRISIQYVPGWDTWHRQADNRKPWLGWGILIGSCIMFVIAVRFGREASDPFREAREKRLRGRSE